jgi:hypothetical protein
MRDATVDRAIIAAFIAIFIAIALYSLLEAAPWKQIKSTEGCVTSYEQIHHPNDHDITDTYFSVGRSAFHLNDGFWVPGFKAADAFKLGNRVRVTERGSHVADVSVLSPSCQS